MYVVFISCTGKLSRQANDLRESVMRADGRRRNHTRMGVKFIALGL